MASSNGWDTEAWQDGPENLFEREKSDSPRRYVMGISRTPVDCPIGDCTSAVGISFLMAHYLRDHTNVAEEKYKEVFVDKKFNLIFDAAHLHLDKNSCLGAVAYGGREDDKSSYPAIRGLSMPNTMLPSRYSHFGGHLPVFILACRTPWEILLPSGLGEKEISNDVDRNQELILIWLATLETTKPIFCTVTVYDEKMTASRSRIMQVRSLSDSQDPKDFAFTESNSMRITAGEINILSEDRKSDIQMEVILKEFE